MNTRIGEINIITEADIVNAGIDYQMSKCPIAIGGDSFYDMAREMNRNYSFEEGAKWAINQLKKYEYKNSEEDS